MSASVDCRFRDGRIGVSPWVELEDREMYTGRDPWENAAEADLYHILS